MGMTPTEVEQILGTPVDDADAASAMRRKTWEDWEDYSESRFAPEALRKPPWPDDWTVKVWVSDEAKIQVWYNADGKVIETRIHMADPENTWRAWVRRRLGL
jgi:hypothetical protein